MRNIFSKQTTIAGNDIQMLLCNEKQFYKHLEKDLKSASSHVYIESPYMTTRRVAMLAPLFVKLIKCDVTITIVTRSLSEHDSKLRKHSISCSAYLRLLGVQVIHITGYHHRKLAIIDSAIVWEGSLNILSQNNSKEIMRRIASNKVARETLGFVKRYR